MCCFYVNSDCIFGSIVMTQRMSEVVLKTGSNSQEVGSLAVNTRIIRFRYDFCYPKVLIISYASQGVLNGPCSDAPPDRKMVQ